MKNTICNVAALKAVLVVATLFVVAFAAAQGKPPIQLYDEQPKAGSTPTDGAADNGGSGDMKVGLTVYNIIKSTTINEAKVEEATHSPIHHARDIVAKYYGPSRSEMRKDSQQAANHAANQVMDHIDPQLDNIKLGIFGLGLGELAISGQVSDVQKGVNDLGDSQKKEFAQSRDEVKTYFAAGCAIIVAVVLVLALVSLVSARRRN